MLWPEDMAGAPSLVVLSACDDLVPFDLVRAQVRLACPPESFWGQGRRNQALHPAAILGDSVRNRQCLQSLRSRRSFAPYTLRQFHAAHLTESLLCAFEGLFFPEP